MNVLAGVGFSDRPKKAPKYHVSNGGTPSNVLAGVGFSGRPKKVPKSHVLAGVPSSTKVNTGSFFGKIGQNWPKSAKIREIWGFFLKNSFSHGILGRPAKILGIPRVHWGTLVNKAKYEVFFRQNWDKIGQNRPKSGKFGGFSSKTASPTVL